MKIMMFEKHYFCQPNNILSLMDVMDNYVKK